LAQIPDLKEKYIHNPSKNQVFPIEKDLGYAFKNKLLLAQSITHSSIRNIANLKIFQAACRAIPNVFNRGFFTNKAEYENIVNCKEDITEKQLQETVALINKIKTSEISNERLCFIGEAIYKFLVCELLSELLPKLLLKMEKTMEDEGTDALIKDNSNFFLCRDIRMHFTIR